jgi:glycosyltransferase involved in cell wall biosynthesis
MREGTDGGMTLELNVCHVSTMTNWGGVERLVEDVLTYPPQGGVRHHLLATSWSSKVVDPIRAAGVSTLLMERKGRFDMAAIRQGVAWLRHEKIDVIHAYNAYANIWGRMLATLARIPVFIAGEHGTIWRTDRAIFQLDRYAQRTARGVIANSQAAATLAQRRYGVWPDKIHVIYNAVAPLPPADAGALRRSLGLEGALIVGSVGRLDTPKDYRTFIDAAALALAQNADLRFLLVGGGPLEAELRAQVNALDLDGRFVMTGWRDDARQLVQIFDLFVGTSIRESFGNAFVEAALAGVPAVAPAVDGIPEVIIDGETGRLLTPRRPIRPSMTANATPIGPYALINGQLTPPRSLDPAELAGEIVQLMTDRQRRARLGEAARRRAQLRFGLERYIMELSALYRRLAGAATPEFHHL